MIPLDGMVLVEERVAAMPVPAEQRMSFRERVSFGERMSFGERALAGRREQGHPPVGRRAPIPARSSAARGQPPKRTDFHKKSPARPAQPSRATLLDAHQQTFRTCP